MAALMLPDLRERRHRTVEVAGIEPVLRRVDALGQGAELRKRPDGSGSVWSRWAPSLTPSTPFTKSRGVFPPGIGSSRRRPIVGDARPDAQVGRKIGAGGLLNPV